MRRRTDETVVRIVFPLKRDDEVEEIEDRVLLASVAEALHLPG